MNAARPDKSVIPWPQLALLLAACAAGVYLLLPDDRAAVENLIRDGKWTEARAALDRISPSRRGADPVGFQRLDLRIARATLPRSDGPAAAAFWQRAVEIWRQNGCAAELWTEISPVVALLPDAAAAWSAVAASAVRLDPADRHALLDTLQRAALAQNRPALAAELFALRYPAAERTAAQTAELVRLWTLASAPDRALAALGESPPADLSSTRIGLLRQLNRSADALELRLAELGPIAPERLEKAAVAELVALAAESGRPAAAVPVLERFVQAHPADAAGLRLLRDTLVAANRAVDALAPARQVAAQTPADAADLRAVGRIAEWAGLPADAFDAWLRLALATGDLPAVDRLIALNPGLYRDTDLLRALERVVPVAGAPDYTLRLARLEVVLGRYAAAGRFFESYLAAVPGDPAVMAEFGRLLADLNRYADAERWLRAAAAAPNADPALPRALADLLIFQGRHLEALDAFARLVATAPSTESIDAYLRLAESLGRYEDMTRALRARLARNQEPEARDYLLLAYAYEASGDTPRRRAVLEEALLRLPAADDIRLALANALSEEKNFVRAQAVLAPHRHLRDEPAATSLFLELMRLNNDTAAERRFLQAPLPPATADDETVRERIAVAREALRDYAGAERLWRGLLAERPDDPDRAAALVRVLLLRGQSREAHALLAPLLLRPTPAILKLAADIATAAGQHRDAERYQLAYLAAVPAAAYSDWSALGDIRLSRGDRTGAKRAYAEALRRLHAGLGSPGGAQ